MPIPIPSTLIANARNYDYSGTAIAIALCDNPPEGTKCIPMQFAFSATAVWFVDLSKGNPGPQISQISALYVDATVSEHDITVLFPETGFKYRVQYGTARIVPVFASKNIPKFYVVLEDSGATSLTDTCTVTALNRLIPEFQTQSFIQQISMGYGQFFELQPTFTQSAQFSQSFTANIQNAQTLINATQWYLTAINVSAEYISAAPVSCRIKLIDNTTTFYEVPFTSGTTLMDERFINLSGLNLISSNTGPLKAQVTGAGSLSGYTFSFNVMGGILIP